MQHLGAAGIAATHIGSPQFMGLGAAHSAEASMYFVVVACPGAQRFRRSLGLGSLDLHVTLGFAPFDLYDVAKDPSTIVARRSETYRRDPGAG